MSMEPLITLASRVERIKPSPTSTMNKHLRALRQQGRDILGLHIGEPDLPTPPHIVEAAIQGMRSGMTKYTNVDGMPALKVAIRDKLRRENALEYDTEQIVVSTGAKHVIFQAILATVSAGDEAVIPAACWVSYPDMVSLAGGTPRIVPAESGFRLPIDGIARALGPRTRWIIINNPCNPTGVAYTRDELAALADLLRAHPHVLLLEDDIYEHLLYDGRSFLTLPNVAPDLQSRVLVVNGVSKSYAMTGWRIGYGAGHGKLISAIVKLQSQATSSTSSVSQVAATAALEGGFACVQEMRSIFEARRDLVGRELAGIPGLDFAVPEGTFYFFCGCSALLGRRAGGEAEIRSDEALALHLLEHGVAVVPGSAFLCSPYFRVSFAASEATLVEGCARIRKAISQLY